MTTILVGGVAKGEVASAIREAGEDGLDVKVSNDMEAAAKLRSGQADYYFGTCHTGAGGALGVLTGILGDDKVETFGRGAGNEESVRKALDEGKVAFGFSTDQVDSIVPALLGVIRERS